MSCVRFSPPNANPIIVSVGWDKTDCKLKTNHRGHNGYINAIFGGKDGNAMLWDLNEGKHLYTHEGNGIIMIACNEMDTTEPPFSEKRFEEIESTGRDIPAPISSFDDPIDGKGGKLSPAILENIKRSGYTKPTPIHNHALPVIACRTRPHGLRAQTGSW